MADRVFGEIPQYPPGSWWAYRKEVSATGVHRPPRAGICGSAESGAESIVISGGYPDDVDHGGEIVYTGHGGQNAITKVQIADQSFEDSGNAALLASQRLRKPVRVIRGKDGDPLFSPTSGY
jgi:putative restriction endonuclease